ncbi:hypothetical protein RZN22_13505 [Bacillaceae bacterium S4-13-58]
MKGFKLVCEDCGEEAVVDDSSSKGIIGGNKLQIDLDANEEDPDYTEINIDCLNCGNYIRLN